MSYESIMKEIKAGLTGNVDQDLQFLREQMETYKEHENAQEILRECGRMMYDLLPEETKEKMRQEIKKDDDDLQQQLDQTELFLYRKEFDRALEIIEPVAKRMDFLIDAGLSANDNVTEYYCFSELFQNILYRNRSRSEKQFRDAQLPFSKIYLYYGIVLVDLKRYEEAAAALEKSLRWNPVDVGTLFEYAETFKFRGELERFFELTTDAFKIAYRPASVARCFRNLGYYYTEKKVWDYAAACFFISMNYEPNDKNAQSELYYIKQMAGREIDLPKFDEFKQFAKDNGFPAGASFEVLAIALQFGQHFFDSGEYDLAEYFLSIYYDLTDDKEVKEMLDRIKENSGNKKED